jgi:hypothetical protein
MRKILFLSLLLIAALFLMCAGCTQGQPSASQAPPASPTVVKTTITTVPTTLPTPLPAVSTPATPAPRQITDGYWCRKTTINIGNAPTEILECYQFLPDGTFRWGYSPGWPMGKSPSCLAPNVKCEYTLNPDGRYEVEGGYFYTLTGDLLIDPHDPPYFTYSIKGIP